jgi:hypothetical protein
VSLDTAIKARLDGFDALKALVSTRNYAVTLPQSTKLPATTWSVISEQPLHAMSADGAYREARVQVDSWALSHTKCLAVDLEVQAALSRFRGTSGGTVVQDVIEEGVTELFHGEVNEGVYQRSRDFRVFYE